MVERSYADRSYRLRKFKSDAMMTVTVLATVITLIPLFAILGYLFYKGASSVNLAFFTHMPKPVGEKGGGMANAIVGTFELTSVGVKLAQQGTHIAGTLFGVLLLRRCQACGTFMSPAGGIGTPLRPLCSSCFSADLAWAPAGGRGTLYSFALMHQLYDPAFADDIPYNIAVVELDEGVRMMVPLQNIPVDSARLGMRLRVCWQRLSDEITYPAFEPDV